MVCRVYLPVQPSLLHPHTTLPAAGNFPTDVRVYLVANWHNTLAVPELALLAEAEKLEGGGG